MNPAAWGGLSALSLGSSDFLARFSARAVGADLVYTVVVLVGAMALSLWIWLTGHALVWEPSAAWLVVLNGAATALMSVLLYAALARGPVSVVAPIVAAHPVLVLAFWVLLGTEPTALQWGAMGATIAGTVVVARAGGGAREPGQSGAAFRITLCIAGGACLAYTAMVVAGQSAVPAYGELQTLWLGRLVSLLCMAGVLWLRGRRLREIPRRWWPVLIVQGFLDAFGYLFLFAGSHAEGAAIAAVTASAFGAVTTLLARFILKEPISAAQWGGIALVFGGIAVLSAAPLG